MSDLRKAAQQALDAMELMDRIMQRSPRTDAAITALRAALAKCNHPDCVDNGPDGKCTRWLLAECEKSEDYQR